MNTEGNHGRHQYLGRYNGRHQRFISKLLSSKERSECQRKMPRIMRQIEREKQGVDKRAGR
jgi:hypothetical protein